MPKRCTICTHAYQYVIDQSLLEGESQRALAARYGVSVSALSRHAKHLRRALASGREAAKVNHHQALLDKLDLYEFRLEKIFHKAQDHNSLHVSLGCIQEAVRIFTLKERIRQTPPDKS